MIQVADNFNYRGKKPNFDRDSFDTLQDMKNYSENSLDDGHISYCKETNKHYKFNSNNQSDPTTGKWVEQHEAVPADEEDITEQNGTLQLANKTYDKQSFSGLGGILLDQNFSGVNNKFNINREDINLVSSIRNNTLVKDIVKYIDYKDIPTLNMVANLGGVSIEYIKGKPVISGDMYVSKMGTTQERPANIINKGFQYFDTTINKPIFWDGAKWIDATGATV